MNSPMPQRNCGAMAVHRRLLNTRPDYARARALLANRTLTLARERGREGITTLPVVVHVVHHADSPEQNLSLAQVQSQIDALNRDFRCRNEDVDQVPAPYRDRVADARIEFALASVDPAGQPTDGITRTATTTERFSDDDAIKSKARGGADPWPADRYLNIWTAPWIESSVGDLLGYAQFPGGPPETDGVVILHSAFGTTGSATAPFNLGRTTAHEVGHWLNLFHIWGDDDEGCSGTDFIEDTPNQGGPNFGTPTFPTHSCNNGPHGDLFMNFMDYVDDAAMFMFTRGQVARMQATLDAARPGLGSVRPLPAPGGTARPGG